MSQEKTCMGRLLRAEKMKYRRSGTDMLWYLLPVLTLAVAFVLSTTYGTVSAYNWWYVGMYPAMTGLLCCLAAGKDGKMEDRAILSLPVPLARLWDAKVLTCILWMVKANILLALAVWITGNLIFPHLGMSQTLQVSLSQAGAAVLVMVVAGSWQVPFCLFLGRRLGMLPALLIQMGLTLTGILAAVTPFWMVDLYAILPRMMCVVIGVLPNNMPARPGNPTFSAELLDPASLAPGLAISLALLVLLWCLSRRWYERKGAARV